VPRFQRFLFLTVNLGLDTGFAAPPLRGLKHLRRTADKRIRG